ncbi:thioredoxin family protein [Thiolapillus sp.]
MRISMTVVLLLFGQLLAAATEGELSTGLVNPGYHEQPSWFKESFLDLREDVEEATAAGKRVLLYFYQDGCPYCARLLKDNFGNPEIAQKTRRHFDVIAINLWGDREVTDLRGQATTEKRFAESLKVQYTPTLLFLDEQGKVVARLNGYYEPDKFNVVLDYVAGKHESEMKLSAYYRQQRAAGSGGKLNEEPFFLPHPLKLADNRRQSWRPLLVLFEQPDCKPCDQLHQDSFRRESLVLALSAFDIAQVNMNSDEKLQTPDGRLLSARQWTESLGLQYAPSMVYFDADGKEVFRSEAWLKAFHLHAVLDYVATGAYLHQRNFQRFVQHRADMLREKGFEVDLMR